IAEAVQQLSVRNKYYLLSSPSLQAKYWSNFQNLSMSQNAARIGLAFPWSLTILDLSGTGMRFSSEKLLQFFKNCEKYVQPLKLGCANRKYSCIAAINPSKFCGIC